jgi:hypothetical protein
MGVSAMPKLCPVCGNFYEHVLRGKKATIPEEYTACHRSVELAGGGTIGKWYLHDQAAEVDA